MSIFLGSKDDNKHTGLERFMIGKEGDDFLTYLGTRSAALSGGQGDDQLKGGQSGDLISGGKDDDELSGGLGNDILAGGRGSDLLIGGPGNDYLTGGRGKDTFLLGLDAGGGETISDFEHGRDKIALPELPEGPLPVYDPGSGLLAYDPPGNTGRPIFIAALEVGLTITSDDFLIG